MTAIQWTGRNAKKVDELTGLKSRKLEHEDGDELYVYLSDDEQLVVAKGRWVVVDKGKLSVSDVGPV